MCSDKSHIQKSGDVTASKSKQISKSARLITHLQDMSSITGTFEIFRIPFLQKFPEHTFQ